MFSYKVKSLDYISANTRTIIHNCGAELYAAVVIQCKGDVQYLFSLFIINS